MRLDHLLSREGRSRELHYCLSVGGQRGSGGGCAGRSAGEGTDRHTIPVAMRLGETPVPIPNTMVKPQAADGTMLETAWESRWLPDPMGV